MNKKGSFELFVLITGFAIIASLIICIMGFDYVPAGNVGVKDKLGVVNSVPWGPGVQWTGFFTSTKKFNTKIQLQEYDVDAFSSDTQIVHTKVALNFRIEPSKAPEIYKNIGIDYQDIIIAPVVQETVKANTAKYSLGELTSAREVVKNRITAVLIEKLSDKGLIVTEVSLTNFEFSDEVKAAIENKQVAEQDALAAENRLDEMRFASQAMKLQTEVLEIKKLDLEAARIEVERIKAEKWNGVMPTTLLSSNENTPLLMSIGSSSS